MDKVTLSVFESVKGTKDADGLPCTVRVAWVAARVIGQDRFWPHFHHFHVFVGANSALDAHRLQERIEAALGDATGAIPASRIADSPYWTRDPREGSPLDDLEPGGLEWELECQERFETTGSYLP